MNTDEIARWKSIIDEDIARAAVWLELQSGNAACFGCLNARIAEDQAILERLHARQSSESVAVPWTNQELR